jgi:hypothetical protein
VKKIGILLSSTDCDKFNYETVSEMAKSDKIQLYYLVSKDINQKASLWYKIVRKIKNEGLFGLAGTILFGQIETIERKILFILTKNQKIRDFDKSYNINEFNKNPITYLNPIFSASGLTVRYSQEDILKVKSLGLDLMVRANARGIFKGEILKTAVEGIISFHHGDNRWNRGGPPAFWEVYLRRPSTGFIVQILNEEIDGGTVLFRGEIPTGRSFTENIVNLLNESNPYLSKIILDFAGNGKLLRQEERYPFGGRLYKMPSVFQSASYIWRTSALFISMLISLFVLGRRDRWGVAYTNGPWRDAVLRKGTPIKNVRHHFFADPFVITKNNRTIIFVEDFSFDRQRGHISAIEITDKNSYELLGPVIREPFHMSFPFLFEYNHELFMIPETSESNAIRLYKCNEFPMRWQYLKDIFKGCFAVDTMVFEYNSVWWLFTNMASKGNYDLNSKLMAFYNTDPLSDKWIEHASNPLVFDCNIARNGGLLDISSQSPLRIRQRHAFNSYGNAYSIAKITELSPASYLEKEVAAVTPDFFPGIKGCHHLNSNGRYTVYDYFRNESIR